MPAVTSCATLGYAAFDLDVALMGGVSTIILARGSVEEVRQECRRCIREAGENGGYILAAGDMLPTETAPEKVQAMIDVACHEGNYGS